MTAPWTPRERRMREALKWLEVYAEVQVRDYPTAANTLNWKKLLAALADQPSPDPRDEALRLAEEALSKLLLATSTIEVLGEYEALDINAGSRRTMRARVDGVINDGRVALAAIAAAKGDSNAQR